VLVDAVKAPNQARIRAARATLEPIKHFLQTTIFEKLNKIDAKSWVQAGWMQREVNDAPFGRDRGIGKMTRTLIYKMVALKDPDHERGIFGLPDEKLDCMGRVRGYEFDSVVGIGGDGKDAQRSGIARRLVWVGKGRERENWSLRGPTLRFKHFRYFGEEGKHLGERYKALAAYMYMNSKHFVVFDLDHTDESIRTEIGDILRDAESAPSSVSFEEARSFFLAAAQLDSSSCQNGTKVCRGLRQQSKLAPGSCRKER